MTGDSAKWWDQRLWTIWLELGVLSIVAPGCTFEATQGGTCDVENAQKNGYICRNGQWQPFEPDVLSRGDASSSTPMDTGSDSPSPITEDDSTSPSESDARDGTSDPSDAADVEDEADTSSPARDADAEPDTALNDTSSPPEDASEIRDTAPSPEDAAPGDDDASDSVDDRDGSARDTDRGDGDARDTDGSDIDDRDADGGRDSTGCDDDSECPSNVCRNNTCVAATCNDGIQNGGETDVDCGGPDCSGCAEGQACQKEQDCRGSDLTCINGECLTCKNGETRRTPPSTRQSCGYKDRGTPYDACQNNQWKTAAECRGVWYASCEEYFADNPRTGAGQYELDPDGPQGSTPSETYQCSSDGWTRVAFDTFDSGNAPGWSDQRTSTCGPYGRILGGDDRFGEIDVGKTFRFAPIPHERIRAELTFIAIDNWEASGPQKDRAGIQLQQQPGPAARFSGTNGSQECGRGLPGFLESDRRFRQTIRRSADNIQLFVGARTTAGPDNESWGIDDVEIWVK